MAERKSFVLYLDWRAWLDLLSNEQKGAWVSALFDYQSQGQPYDGDDPMVKMAFSFARTTLDRDNEKYQARCASNARNGQKGGRPRKDAGAAEPLPGPEETDCPEEAGAPFAEPEELPEDPWACGALRPNPAGRTGYTPEQANRAAYLKAQREKWESCGRPRAAPAGNATSCYNTFDLTRPGWAANGTTGAARR